MSNSVESWVKGKLEDLELEDKFEKSELQLNVRIDAKYVFMLEKLSEKLRLSRAATSAQLLSSAIFDAWKHIGFEYSDDVRDYYLASDSDGNIYQRDFGCYPFYPSGEYWDEFTKFMFDKVGVGIVGDRLLAIEEEQKALEGLSEVNRMVKDLAKSEEESE